MKSQLENGGIDEETLVRFDWRVKITLKYCIVFLIDRSFLLVCAVIIASRAGKA